MNGPGRQHGKTTGPSLWEVSGAPILQIIIIVVATVTCNVPVMHCYYISIHVCDEYGNAM